MVIAAIIIIITMWVATLHPRPVERRVQSESEVGPRLNTATC